MEKFTGDVGRLSPLATGDSEILGIYIRERETHTHTHTQTQTQTETERHTQTDRERRGETVKDRERQGETEKDKKRDRVKRTCTCQIVCGQSSISLYVCAGK